MKKFRYRNLRQKKKMEIMLMMMKVLKNKTMKNLDLKTRIRTNYRSKTQMQMIMVFKKNRIILAKRYLWFRMKRIPRPWIKNSNQRKFLTRKALLNKFKLKEKQHNL